LLHTVDDATTTQSPHAALLKELGFFREAGAMVYSERASVTD
jgi:hypothetical protein